MNHWRYSTVALKIQDISKRQTFPISIYYKVLPLGCSILTCDQQVYANRIKGDAWLTWTKEYRNDTNNQEHRMTIIEPRQWQSQLTSVRRTGSQSFYANIFDFNNIYISISANIEWSL